MKKLILSVGALVLAVVGACSAMSTPTFAALAAGACPTGSLNAGKEAQLNSIAECNIEIPDKTKNEDLMSRVKLVINVILGVVGLVAVVVIILGGISFMTSQGDTGKVTKARNTILYGVIGLIVALLAFAIVNFVLTGIFT